MWIDFIDRTRELLCDAKVSHDDIAFLSGLDKQWINRIKTCSEGAARREDASCIQKLHDWLIVLEVASGSPRFEPDEMLLHLGETAVYYYRHRQSDGLFPTNEREHILQAASAQLKDMRHGLPQAQ